MTPPAKSLDPALPASASETTPEPVTLSSAGLRRGARLALPFCASSVVYGLAFGLLATEVGLSSLEATLMSLLVFSGSAQIAVVQAWRDEPVVLAIFVTVLVANIRYVLMGAALRSWLAPLGAFKSTLALLPLVDGSFALSFRERSRGNQDAGVLVGSSLVSWFGWIVGTTVGTLAGQLIPNPRAIGLDFVIVAFCAASATTMARTRADLLPALAALIAVVAFERYAPGPWSVVVAGATAAIFAMLRFKPEPNAASDRTL